MGLTPYSWACFLNAANPARTPFPRRARRPLSVD